MPRIRSIKPEIFVSPQVMNLSRDARLLFIGLISQADDEGRGTADPRKLKAAIFPGDDDIPSASVHALLAELEAQALCVTYDGNGHGRLYALPSFREHQYIQKPKKSSYPGPPNGSDHGNVQEQSDTSTGGSDRIGSDRMDRKDLTRARAEGEQPGDNSGRRALASDGKKPADRKEEIERNRRKAAELAAGLAAAAKV
jgi:hypothetical protein